MNGPISGVVAPSSAPSAQGPLHAPMSLAELPTTDGNIAMGNLIASLPTAEAFAKARRNDAVVYFNVVKLLCALAQYRGTLADYDHAEQVVETAMKLAPKSAHSFLARAQLRSTFHEFDAALADLAQAEKLDEEVAGVVQQARAGIMTALGKTDEALASYHAHNARNPDLVTMALEAGLLSDRGELAAADDLYMRAQLTFGDVSPFPVVWLYFQHGLMWEREGNLAHARELFAAAVLRLPMYAAAVSHLAAAEAVSARRDSAIKRLQSLLETADDPEYKGQLAQLLMDAGRTQEAEPLLAKARTEYAALLAKHPRAFASHAAHFYLGPGADPQAALKWAESNLATAATPDAQSLVVEAATAAGATARACTIADQLTKRPYVSPQAHIIAARAYLACGQRDRATAETLAATK